jgi:hypothetical protein
MTLDKAQKNEEDPIFSMFPSGSVNYSIFKSSGLGWIFTKL